MGTKGQPLIIHSGCQTMLAGCYLGWGSPIELFRGRILFLSKGSMIVQMFASVLSWCRSPLSLQNWPWLSLQRRHGWHRRWQGLVFPSILQNSSPATANRIDFSELAALSTPSVCLQYIMCHDAPGWCQWKKKRPEEYSFVMSYSAFYLRCGFLFWYTCHVNCS